MKKPHNWDSLIASFNECQFPYAYIVAFYLSKFDRDAYKKLGFGNQTETHKKISDILKTTPSNVRLNRDYFDPIHKNNRKGFDKKVLARSQQEVYEGFKGYSEQELYSLVCKILDNPKKSFEYFFDSILEDNVLVNDEVTDEYNVLVSHEVTNEVEDNKSFKEGSFRLLEISSYERNDQARKKCIEYFGTNCCVCEFNFEKHYGQIGKGFIHVHHLIPLSEIHQEYEVDPIKDLRPVCPNCHAMIHQNDPPFTIEQLKNLLHSQDLVY